ncbi:hypothetical protein EK21DRAFT_100782 [Setomelanomma holmii]|uniref:Uncharacterized protein n=1 Tax=Setomelanomma holmii TaxID=210430 RepID=A0A9P4LMU4_9PLEO|nr:hypothetical protein EK21DRAFT_100782 [Setomelanomma holmii]
MVDETKDYYDLPTEWLPTANFAGRPTSEISELNLMDGLWTFIISSSSSSSSSEVEDGPTQSSRNTVKSSHTEPDALQQPSLEMASPGDVSPKARGRRLSDDVKVMERPRLRKKSATTPPGGFGMPDHAPQLPRRAVSARQGRSNTTKKRNPKPYVAGMSLLAAREEGGNGAGGPVVQHAPPTGALPQPQQTRHQSEDAQNGRDARLSDSFSQKARVRKTLVDKNLQRLDIRIVDFEARGLLSSPLSMLNTPRELYVIPEQQPMRQNPTSPQPIDARRSILHCLSKSTSSTRHPKAQERQYSRPERQRIYLPGTICLEEDPAMLRRDSVATRDPFDKAIKPRGKSFSDMVMLDGITMYFEEFNIIQEATEQCLDQYWCDTSRGQHRAAGSRPSSVTSVEEPTPKSPRKPQSGRSPHNSRFSFSSTSSTSSQPRAGTPTVRQRDRLRKLLSPVFPGSAFLKSSTDWGEKTDHS